MKKLQSWFNKISLIYKKYFFLLISFILISISRVEAGEWKFFNKDNSGISSNSIRQVVQDKKGNYWIASIDNGLIKFDGKKWTSYNTSNSKIPNNYIFYLTTDKYDNLWIGTFGGGLVKFDGKKKWKVYNSKNSGLPNDWIYAITIDKQNKIWIGTYSEGLVRFHNNKWKVYNNSNSILTSNKITALACDKKNNLWIATSDSLFFLEKNNLKTQSMISYSAVDETPYSIAAGDNNVYIAYKFGGITVYDGNNFKIFKKDSGLPIEGFYSVVVDRNKNVFASSFGLGVLKYTDGVWNHINSKNSELKEDTIFSTFVDSNNTKWFCTLNSGLCLFNEDSIALK